MSYWTKISLAAYTWCWWICFVDCRR